MRILGLDIRRTTKAAPASLSPVSSIGYGSRLWTLISEPFAGAWQQNVVASVQDAVTNPTVWACVTLIARDVSRLWVKLVEQDDNRIRTETTNTAYSPVLDTPNHYQTRVKFFEYWMLSKLLRGNTYVLKERNNRGGPEQGNVVALYILDATLVQPMVAPNGEVFYALGQDYLSGVTDASVIVPASEIIHDIMVPLYHPLVGVSPIHASGMAALQGLQIQKNSSKLFANGSQPGGVLTTPHSITPEQAERFRQNWDANFSGPDNVGRTVILGDAMTYVPLAQTAVDAQLIDQLKWSDERICSTHHVPGYKIGIGPAPPYTDIQSINLEYYNQALAPEIENLEELLTKGLGMSKRLSVEFDLTALLRMDTKTQVDNATKGILGGLWKPNEARAEFDLLPVEGGDTVYLQNQQWSLAALDRRDAMALPAAPALPQPAALPQAPDDTRKTFDYSVFLTTTERRLEERRKAEKPAKAQDAEGLSRAS